MFNGFISLDSKFWTTFIPLLTKPGRVSKDYIEGKRVRYSNPFQFYLTVSIIFFLIVGLSKTVDKFQQLQKGSKSTNEVVLNTEEENKDVDIDSLKNAIDKRLEKSWIPLDSVTRKEFVEEIGKQVEEEKSDNTTSNSLDFGGDTKMDKFIEYHLANKEVEADDALESLNFKKTFFNRFLYSRAKVLNSFVNEKESREQFLSQLLSYASVALFVFLPLFTLFLKLFYIRGNYTYVEHLVFVFHTQTVFFMLFSIYYLLALIGVSPQLWIFILLFVIYLLIAMKSFYQQGFFKTFIKFLLINSVYFFLGFIGVFVVAAVSFALL